MAEKGVKVAVPTLRFPEFRGAPVWVVENLSDVAEFINEKISILKLQPSDYVSTENLLPDYGEIELASRLPTVSSVTRFKRNDVLISNIRPYLKKVWRADWDGGASNDVVVLRAKSSLSAKFFSLVVRNDAFIAYVMESARGVKMPRGDVAAMRDYAVAYPKPAEQQKVAECLTSLDELIAAQGQKVEALKAHKRGLMQQLFPREGETRPRLRLPEFRDASEWRVKLAGKLFANRKEDGEDGLPIYSVTVNNGMILRASFDRDFYDIQEPAGNKKVHEGDIAYNMMRMWQGAQGVAVEDCMVSPAYVVLSPRESVYSPFFSYLFKLSQSLDLLVAYSRGLTKDRLRLYFDDFARMPLCVPGHAEQKRIADFLSSLDKRIVTESDQLVALKIHRQGLMQQLFPTQGAG